MSVGRNVSELGLPGVVGVLCHMVIHVAINCL